MGENLCPVHEEEADMASVLLAMLYTHPPSLNKIPPSRADAGATVPFRDTGQPKALINFITPLLPFDQAISPEKTGHEAYLELIYRLNVYNPLSNSPQFGLILL